jgi:hypothetical protein
MEHKCLYCDNILKKELSNRIELTKVLIFHKLIKTFLYCENHGDILVSYVTNQSGSNIDNLSFICKLENEIYEVFIDKSTEEEDKMILSSFNNNKYMYLPVDFNLTPENFKNKLKTYLNFQ